MSFSSVVTTEVDIILGEMRSNSEQRVFFNEDPSVTQISSTLTYPGSREFTSTVYLLVCRLHTHTHTHTHTQTHTTLMLLYVQKIWQEPTIIVLLMFKKACSCPHECMLYTCDLIDTHTHTHNINVTVCPENLAKDIFTNVQKGL